MCYVDFMGRRQRLLLIVCSLLVFSVVNGAGNSLTHINLDLYHSSGKLMEEITHLVHRHPDKLTLETVKNVNKGYNAEISVVTYCSSRNDVDDDSSKFWILL